MVVVDHTVQSIMSYCVEKHELLDRQVANILQLDEPRPSEAYLPAIYICEPSKFNAACIAADFTRLPNRYQKAYVFFLPGATTPLIMDLKTRLGHRLARIEEAPIMFWPIERKVFTLHDKTANDRLYNPNVRSKEAYIGRMAHHITNVCKALGEVPYIRHLQPSRVYRDNQLPGLLAATVHSQLGKEQLEQGVADRKGRAILLILDRSVDPVAPLLHEFTYQAMATDLLTFGPGNSYESKDKTTKGKLDEKDVDWVALRHLHISQVTEELTARVRQLRESNPHFADTTTDVSVHDIRNMVAGLPAFVKSKDQVALNLQIALDCIAAMDEKMLKELADVEQTAVLGVDADGERPTHLSDDFVKLLAQGKVSLTDKIRLIAVYVLGRQSGLFTQDYERLRRHSNLGEWDMDCIRNLANFGYQTEKSDGDITTPGLSSSLRKGAGSEPVYYSEATGEQFLFARFVPGVKNIVEKLIANQLDPQQFPYVGEAPENDADALDTATSLRNPRQRATWVKNKVNQPAKQRIIVYMVGGFSASEARSVYELSKKYPKDVLIGGNDMISPGAFVYALGRQKLPVSDLKLPVLLRDGPAPDYLLESDRDTNKRAAAAAAQQPSLGAAPPSGVPSTGNGNEIRNAEAQAQGLQPVKESKRRGLFSRKKK